MQLARFWIICHRKTPPRCEGWLRNGHFRTSIQASTGRAVQSLVQTPDGRFNSRSNGAAGAAALFAITGWKAQPEIIVESGRNGGVRGLEDS